MLTFVFRPAPTLPERIELGVDRLRVTWCACSPPVHRSRKHEHAQPHGTHAQRARETGRGIACPTAWVSHARHAMVPPIGVLLRPPPSRGPCRTFLTAPVGVRGEGYGLPLRSCAPQPRRLPRSNKQVWIVVGPWSAAPQQPSPSPPAAAGVGVGRGIRRGVGDRRRHNLDLRVAEKGRSRSTAGVDRALRPAGSSMSDVH
jgi:hypothetical protein